MCAIDFNNPAFVSNPYPVYRQLREAGGPYWLQHTQPISSSGMWLFSRYVDVAEILKVSGPLSKQISRVRLPEDISPMDLTMLYQDPPEHGRLRNLASQAFSAERIKELEPRIEQIADELITCICTRTTGDFIADFALPLPVRVVSELLGLPFEDHNTFCRWITSILVGFDAVVADKEILRRQKTAMQELTNYFNQLIEERRQYPRNDLISALIEAQDKCNKLTGSELLGMCFLFLIAGYETTTGLIGTGLLTLFLHPEQFELLRQRPEHLPSAVEEMLRFESPLQRATFRITTEACELGGKQLRQGEQICAVIGAANRDPDQFSQPDIFDITRIPNRHLAFGSGIHTCLGAILARTEARIALGRILERLPHIRLSAETPQWNSRTFIRSLRTLPVSY